ncbi:prolyl aminopeptidase [Gammaproteobacteria bacterium 45_16_T64]|mgnify:CR=1 FL=1|nr:prolyl aminopeptidase [Gammaproteobacteria bacterium 45_16_T64]
MMILYPDIKPYREQRFETGTHHVLHVEESGNKDGIPILFLHGGPGSACEPFHRRFFDPEKYRIILFDQRGCGRSTPHANVESNTTQDLIADMEQIRVELEVDHWVLFGGSWGATLALLYAQRYPETVKAMVLRGIFLARQRDLDWLYKDGANRIFPDAWDAFTHNIPAEDHDNLLQAYQDLLAGNNELARMSAAKTWSAWEGHCATLRPNITVMDHFAEPHTALSMARVEVHYFSNNVFIDENQILNNMDIINSIPGIIVHGRYDMVCPLENATELHKRWDAAELQIIRDAGHASSEAGIVDALVRATDSIAKTLGESA